MEPFLHTPTTLKNLLLKGDKVRTYKFEMCADKAQIESVQTCYKVKVET